MDSFVLLAYASLTASRTLLPRLLASLNFTLESEDFFFQLFNYYFSIIQFFQLFNYSIFFQLFNYLVFRSIQKRK